MLISGVSVLVVAQSSSEIPEGLMNKPVQTLFLLDGKSRKVLTLLLYAGFLGYVGQLLSIVICNCKENTN